MKITVIGPDTTSIWSYEVGSFLALILFNNWDEEFKRNDKKNSHPYRYPETFIQFSGLTASAFAYRQLEGFLRALSGFVPSLRSVDYTTYSRESRI
jgi:hypothetical protein